MIGQATRQTVCRALRSGLMVACVLLSLGTRRVCGQQQVRLNKPGPISPEHVLVVMNMQNKDSLAIGAYYVKKRHIPSENVYRLTCPNVEECSNEEYKTQIEMPVVKFIAANKHDIDFIVLTKGIPIRIHDEGMGVDSMLATWGIPARATRMHNPYFNKAERFTFAAYHFRLVTRLDGYTRADCLKLVDNSLAARPVKGLFFLHTGPQHEEPNVKYVNDSMRVTEKILKAKGFECILDTGEAFPGNKKNLMGYFSWGSNDIHYDKAAYNSLSFVPGGLAETVVSTGGRTFNDPKAPGQSLIADLIAQGVTGVKGYVSEPYADAIAHAGLLFDRYTVGFSLAESFYMASRYLHWKDVVIGDPLCAPYAANK